MTTSTKRFLGSGSRSLARALGIGLSNVLGSLRKLADPEASLRQLLCRYPFWTNVSLPSGRTSLIVAWRSTIGREARTHTWTAPAPTTVVSLASGAETYDTAVPAGFGFQVHCHCEALPHSPPPSLLGFA